MIRNDELTEAYGANAKSKFLGDLGQGWEAQFKRTELIAYKNGSPEDAISQLNQKLTDLLGDS